MKYDIKNKGKEFSKENQPTKESRSRGQKKRALLSSIASMVVKGEKLKESKLLAEKVGLLLEDEDMTIEIVMTLVQINKAIEKGDHQSYNSAMDRMRGKATQSIDMSMLDVSQKLINPITIVRQEQKE